MLVALVVIVILIVVLFGALDFLFLIGGVGVGYTDMEEMITHVALSPPPQTIIV